MNDSDRELLEEFVVESRELLEAAEGDLMVMDVSQGEPDPEVINRIFRAVHSVKGAAGFFGLEIIGTLSHRLESVLMKVRDGQLQTTTAMVDVFLKANDRLRALVEDFENSNDQDVTVEVAALQVFLDGGASAEPASAVAFPEPPAAAPLPPAPVVASGHAVVDELELTDELVQRLRSNGRQLFRIHLGSHELADIDRTVPQLLTEVASLGEIHAVSAAPAVALEELTLWLSTVLDRELAAEAFALSPDAIDVVPLVVDGTPVAVTPPPAPAAPVPRAPARAPAKAPPPAAVAPPARAAQRSPSKLPKTTGKSSSATETVRIKTSVLNALMEMAGELVLARNRLVRTLADQVDEIEGLGPVLNQVSTITTNVQEQIMRTRLQPVGSLFGKFRRVVRDLSSKIGKEVVLETRGGDVELDRTIIEGLSDPLVHLMRNSLDHGIERPEEREAAHKPRHGTIRISAYHEAGMVNITVEDDGKGIDVKAVMLKALERGLFTEDQLDRLSDREGLSLIFMPGFSTAKVVTDVSGRGVGMDVVRTNIEKLGGSVDLDSVKGEGTTTTLKLPLTLAIVASLIVEAERQHYALPQVGLQEVIRLRPGDGNEWIEEVRGAAVLRHRGQLLPIVRLADVLGLERTFIHPETGERLPDRRARVADRRSTDPGDVSDHIRAQRSGSDRRYAFTNVQRILVLKIGKNRFGLMVDRILDNEEIVVKPLSRFVRNTPCFSGATILGDGTISMILDPMGLATEAKLRFELTQDTRDDRRNDRDRDLREPMSLVLVSNGTEETFALPLAQISRIEKISAEKVQRVGGREYLTYRGTPLPLLRLHDYLPVQPAPGDEEEIFVLIPKLAGREVGLVVARVLDAVEVDLHIDRENATSDGMFGSTILDDRIVLILDIGRLADIAMPDGSEPTFLEGPRGPMRILLAEDTPSYQVIVSTLLERAGAVVRLVHDGEAAWQALQAEDFDAVVTDTVMPRITGETLVAKIRSHARFKEMPVVLTAAFRWKEASMRVSDPLTGHGHKLDGQSLVSSLIEVTGGAR